VAGMKDSTDARRVANPTVAVSSIEVRKGKVRNRNKKLSHLKIVQIKQVQWIEQYRKMQRSR
jgi:hypothetical protein